MESLEVLLRSVARAVVDKYELEESFRVGKDGVDGVLCESHVVVGNEDDRCFECCCRARVMEDDRVGSMLGRRLRGFEERAPGQKTARAQLLAPSRTTPVVRGRRARGRGVHGLEQPDEPTKP